MGREKILGGRVWKVREPWVKSQIDDHRGEPTSQNGERKQPEFITKKSRERKKKIAQYNAGFGQEFNLKRPGSKKRYEKNIPVALEGGWKVACKKQKQRTRRNGGPGKGQFDGGSSSGES